MMRLTSRIQRISLFIGMLLILSYKAQSYRLWHLNELYNGLNDARYHNLDLRPRFNSWGGKTSGIFIFVSAPHLTTPQGYYVPTQKGDSAIGPKIKRHPASWKIKRAPLRVGFNLFN